VLSDTWVRVRRGPAPGIMALAGLERVLDTAVALAVVHEAVLDEGYRLTSEQAGKLLAAAQTAGL